MSEISHYQESFLLNWRKKNTRYIVLHGWLNAARCHHKTRKEFIRTGKKSLAKYILGKERT